MVLYCVDTPVFIGNVLLHKNAYTYDKKTILMVDRKLYDDRNMSEVLIKLKSMDFIYDIIFCDMFCDTYLDCTEEEYKKYCIEYYDKIFYDAKYKIDSFDEIYSFNDTWNGIINLYFNLKEKDYVWVQCNRVFYSKDYVRGNNVFLQLLDKYDYINPFAPYAKPELRKDCLIEEKKKIKKKYTIWDKQYAIDALSDEIVVKIVQCYGIDEINKSSWLILLNSYGTLRNLDNYSYYVQKRIGMRDYPYVECFSQMNNIMMDYYTPDDSIVYFKTHPNDPISDETLKEIYKNEVKNLSVAPYEFINRYLKTTEKHFEGIIGCISNSVEFLDEELYDKVLLLGASFITSWFFYDSIYIALKYAEQVNKCVYTTEVLGEQVRNLSNEKNLDIMLGSFEYTNGCEYIKNSIVILDCIDIVKNEVSISGVIENLDKSNIICFLNTDLAQIFFEDRFMNFMVPIVINKKSYDNTKLNLHRREIIWIYSSNILNRREVYSFNFEKRFSRRGIDLIVEAVTPDYGASLFEYYSLLNFKRNYLSSKTDR